MTLKETFTKDNFHLHVCKEKLNVHPSYIDNIPVNAMCDMFVCACGLYKIRITHPMYNIFVSVIESENTLKKTLPVSIKDNKVI